MSERGHHHDHHSHGQKPKTSTPLHKNWVTWTVIALMIAAMVFYVLSLDESLIPWGKPQEKVPAVAE